MHAFRGRELPGFTNSQVFYGFMVKNIEEWRPFVDDCRAQYVATTIRVSDELLEALAPTYPSLVSEIRQLVTTILVFLYILYASQLGGFDMTHNFFSES